MTLQFTPEQRAFSKALVLALGTAPAAAEAIEILADAPGSKWPGTPTERTLNMWRKNPEIVPATEVLEQFSKELQLTVGGQMRGLLDPLYKRILDTIENDESSPSDVLNLTKAYSLLVDKVQPKATYGTTFSGPTQVVAPGAGGVMRLFAPKEIEAPVIDEDGNAVD